MSNGMASPRARLWLLGGLVVLVVAGFSGMVYWLINRAAPADPVALLRANNEGVGHMEKFDYRRAVEAFEKVVNMDPTWLPGRINLGIALLNRSSQDPSQLNRSRQVFEGILAERPDDPYANFCLGIISFHKGQLGDIERAAKHFERVTRVDPEDANSWYYLARCTIEDEDREKKLNYLKKAYERNPNHVSIVHNLAQAIGPDDPKRSQQLSTRFEELARIADSIKDIRYGDMGKYAEVIGSHPLQAQNPTGPLPAFLKDKEFKVHLAPGARWATAEDLRNGPEGELRAELRKRFGATMVVFDFDRDGKPDLLLLAAVVEGGKLRDLLLHNEGNGQFRDVTSTAGLGESWASIGCSAGDFDNDGFPDLFITGAGRQRLLRNVPGDKKGARRFEDVTAQAGLDKITDVCLAAAFVDLDQDGDLDLLVTRFAPDAAKAMAVLRGGEPAGAGVILLVNVGEAKQEQPSRDPEPLSPKYQRRDDLLKVAGPATGIVLADLDLDRDIDALVLGGRTPGTLVINDRLLQFHTEGLPGGLIEPGHTGGVALDVAHTDKSDLLLIGPGRAPVLLLNKTTRPSGPPQFERGGVQAPPGLALVQAQVIDLDEDGWTDVVGLSEQGKAVLLHNDGKGHLKHVEEALGADPAAPGKLVAVAVGDFVKERSDVLVWPEGGGLQLYANQGNGNHAVRLELVGHRRATPSGTRTRSNSEGHGTKVIVQTDSHWSGLEFTTLTAVLNQSLQPLVIGLGKHTQADVIRLRWPDNVWQAELGKSAGFHRIDEDNRKPDSCPVLFTWDGERYVFVADFLGAGAIGEATPDRGHRPPRPEESVKIEAGQLKPKNSRYLLKVAEPMDELTYLDRLQLVVVDHPAGVRVYPDERFWSGPPPSQELLAFRADRQIFPVRATNHKGADVTATLREWDRKTVSDFARRMWLGMAEEHSVTLDFGDRLAKAADGDRLLLCLAGWTDYAYPESEWAAAQAGITALAPTLERQNEDGTWRPLGEVGFPAGTPRMITLELTGKQLAGPKCVLRIRTNLHVHWDQIFLARLLARGPKEGLFRATPLEVSDARLSVRGFMQEFSPDGREPTIYDHDRLEKVPVTRWEGKLTRLGDVTELLHHRDDRFVVMGPGDEIAVSFDADKLPALPEGWTRSFVLRSWGYCKGAGPFTTTGGYVEPLPFHGMSNFPYRADERYPQDAAHQGYLRRYQTRKVGMGR